MHGTGLFTRGETQVLSSLALADMGLVQRLDTLEPQTGKRYMHHYNFPPYSTGETGRLGSPRRREIGHGALAERALVSVVPDEESFPYALRVISEVLESNGSSSMASVSGSTLALDGRRRADKGPCRGGRDGLGEGGRRLRHPHRHPGARGPHGRHGLQGRRNARRHNGAPDGHEDHRRLRAAPQGGAGSGQEGQDRDPGHHARCHRRAEFRGLRLRPERRGVADTDGQDRAPHRSGRQDDKRLAGRVRRQHLRRERRHGLRSRG